MCISRIVSLLFLYAMDGKQAWYLKPEDMSVVHYWHFSFSYFNFTDVSMLLHTHTYTHSRSFFSSLTTPVLLWGLVKEKGQEHRTWKGMSLSGSSFLFLLPHYYDKQFVSTQAFSSCHFFLELDSQTLKVSQSSPFLLQVDDVGYFVPEMRTVTKIMTKTKITFFVTPALYMPVNN